MVTSVQILRSLSEDTHPGGEMKVWLLQEQDWSWRGQEGREWKEESDQVQDHSIEIWGQKETELHTGNWRQETWEAETEKAEESMDDTRARPRVPRVAGMGAWGWLCVHASSYCSK